MDDIQSQLLKLKPDPEQKDGGTSFEELRKINPDVCGWITLDHTKIDYPILQGEDNLTYINTDVYGDFALSGSIFLDSGCDRNFGGNILFCMVITWQSTRCSEIWIFTEKRNILTKTPQVRYDPS